MKIVIFLAFTLGLASFGLGDLVAETLTHLDQIKQGNIESHKVDQCDLLERQNGEKFSLYYLPEKLSTKWSQEYTGLDLTKDLFLPIKNKSRTNLLIWDIQGHGSLVKRVAEQNTIHEFQNITLKLDPEFSVSDFSKSKNAYEVINVSMNTDITDYKVFKNYSQASNSIFVLAGGNNNFVYDTTKDNPNLFDEGIFVGSMSPDGLPSSSTRPAENIAILAPADNYMALDATVVRNFGQTSGAAPQVSAAVSMIKSILPNLNAIQAKKLLQMTALPTANAYFTQPRLHGAGMLNAYFLLYAAAKLSEACDRNNLNTDCFESTLKKLKTESQAIQNSDLIDKLDSAFGCNGKNSIPTGKVDSHITCENKRTLLKELRKAAFLHPSYSLYWQALTCIHNDLGFFGNAGFYQKLAYINQAPVPSNLSSTILAWQLISPPKYVPEISKSDPDYDPFTKDFSVSLRPETRKDYQTIVEKKELRLPLEAMLSDKSPDVRHRAAVLMSMLPEKSGAAIPILIEKLKRNSIQSEIDGFPTEEGAEGEAARALANFGEAAVPYLTPLLDQNHFALKKWASFALQLIKKSKNTK